MTSSMIVVANRLPFVLKRRDDGTLFRQPSAGGLVTAMAPVVKQRRGVWIGWPGIYLNESDVIPEGNPDSDNAAESLGGKQTIPVNVNPELFDEYYNGCCNATFWPLMHSMPDRVVFNRDYWSAYVKVNEKFAATSFDVLRTEINESPERKAPLVWIHDYQLMLVASLIRRAADEAGISNTKLAFFHHIPFPSWDIFRLFPWQDEVLVGLLGCDLIGFHVDGYVDNFLECCQKGLGCRVDRERRVVQHDGRAIRVQSFPIGVPFQQFEGMARNSTIETYDDKLVKVVLGVDRLDYTKGIVHRVQAFEKLLEHYPEHKEKVHLFQIAVPSRTDVIEYQELKDELDREIGRINGRFSTSRWSPIRYLYRFMKQEELCAFYRDAFVALVTPIRDGMNLVAKEFVACQIREPGVLILSPFTGAGETMHEALITNPLEEHSLAECIHRALTMPKDERELRMSALRRRERTNDIHHWVRSFLQSTGVFNGHFTDPQLEPLTIAHFEKWLANYVGNSEKLALLLDYDGTLAPIASHPDYAVLPDETRRVLENLCTMQDVYVAVISGRSVKNVKTMVNIADITYAGNHGLDIEHPDGTKFIHPDQAQFTSIIHELKEELEREVCGEGAWLESKGFSLTFHYRNVPTERRPALIDQSTAIILKHGFRPSKSHCGVEARPPIQWDKGRASIHILRTTFGIDWSERVRIIYVGDDTTDEDAMRALKGMATTFRVAGVHTGKTAANYRLHDTQSVLTLLQWVEQHMEKRNKNSPRGSPRNTPPGSPRVSTKE